MNDGKIKGEYSKEDFFKNSDDDRKKMGLRSFYHTKLSDIKILSDDLKDSIKLENLTIQYGNHVVTHIDNLNIPKHKIVAITGENGACKSSFVRAFTGLLKTKNAKIDGENLQAKTQQKTALWLCRM